MALNSATVHFAPKGKKKRTVFNNILTHAENLHLTYPIELLFKVTFMYPQNGVKVNETLNKETPT